MTLHGESNSNVPRKKRQVIFFINTPRLTKDQRVSICLEYARVNNAREVIPAALGRSLATNVYILTIVRLSTGYCCIKYLIGRFWLILDTFKNGSSSLNAALAVNIARKFTGRISKFKLDNTECNARSSRVIALLAFKLKQIRQVNFFLRHPVYSLSRRRS